MTLRKVALSFVLILFTTMATAQNNSDFETWSSLSLKYKFNKKLDLTLEEQLRLKENSSVVDQLFTEAQLGYEIINNVKLAAAVRYSRSNDNEGRIQGYENLIRYNLDISYKHDIERFSLNYRVRFQSRNEIGITDDPQNKTRFRISTEYNIRDWKLDPYFGLELFKEQQETGLEKLRFTLGTEYKFKNDNEFGIFYRIERPQNNNTIEITNILGVQYRFNRERK